MNRDAYPLPEIVAASASEKWADRPLQDTVIALVGSAAGALRESSFALREDDDRRAWHGDGRDARPFRAMLARRHLETVILSASAAVAKIDETWGEALDAIEASRYEDDDPPR